MTSPADTGKPPRIRLYRLRNALREKAGGLGVAAGTGAIPTAALEKAEETFRKMAEDYPDWVNQSLQRLREEFEAAGAKPPESRTPNFHRINQMAHELKGQGGTFGYPLISTFGKSLHEFTGASAGTTDAHMEIIKSHIDAMQAVIKGRIAGNGGAVGAELVKTLERAIEKYTMVGSPEKK